MIAFVDLHAQRARLGARLDAAVAAVLDEGRFILGPQVAQLEAQLAAFCGSPHAVTCANGTDAITLALMSAGVAPGDPVFMPAFTFVATAGAAAQMGARPVFVDVDAQTFNMDPASLAETLAAQGQGQGRGPRRGAVIAVDLFGAPADYAQIAPLAQEAGLTLIADAAQSFGAGHPMGKVGTLADYTTTSFFPAKPLGCYGDGGAVFARSPEQAAALRSLRSHGAGEDRYDSQRVGMNSRLDTLQAAILLEKLRLFPDEIERRGEIAARYTEALRGRFLTPAALPGCRPIWAQYTLRCAEGRCLKGRSAQRRSAQGRSIGASASRDACAAALRAADLPFAVYYSKPLHRQAAYAGCPRAPGGLEVSSALAAEVISLPIHAYLDEKTQARIIKVLLEA